MKFANVRGILGLTGLAAILVLQGCGKSDDVVKAEFKANFDKGCAAQATKDTAAAMGKFCGCMSTKLLDGRSVADLKELDKTDSEKSKKAIDDAGKSCASALAPATPAAASASASVVASAASSAE